MHSCLQSQGALTEPETAKVMRDILAVIRKCHTSSICYADVKPANFLLKNVYPDARCLIQSKSQTDRTLEVNLAFCLEWAHHCAEAGCAIVAFVPESLRLSGSPMVNAVLAFQQLHHTRTPAILTVLALCCSCGDNLVDCESSCILMLITAATLLAEQALTAWLV